jgi:hypothetical protein
MRLTEQWLNYRSGTTISPFVHYGAAGALILLQMLNLFWYYLILRIVVKCTQFVSPIFGLWLLIEIVRLVLTSKAEDVHSDDEDDGEDEHEKPER